MRRKGVAQDFAIMDKIAWVTKQLRPFIPEIHPIKIEKHPDRDVLEVFVGDEFSASSVYGTIPIREIDVLLESNQPKATRDFFYDLSQGYGVPYENRPHTANV
jgi:hypothetical protein